MKEILFSIGLPVVKTEFLMSALKCCLDQSYKNIELVILNNGKTPEIRELIQSIINEFDDHRIKYFENSYQLPIIENWNKTLNLASGELFSLFCDDDIWHQDFITEMISLKLKYPKCKIFHSRVIIINEISTPVKLAPLCSEFESGLDFIWHRLMGYRTQYVSDFAVDRISLLEFGGFVDLPFAWGSDDITWFHLSSIAGIAYSSKPLFFYRDSSVNTTNTMKITQKLKANELYIKYVIEIFQKQENNDLLKNQITANIYNHLYQKNRSLCISYLKKSGIPRIITDFIIYSCFKIWHYLKYCKLKNLSYK